ncbi:MAG: sensor histidine kinase [Chitinophagaceae bacterium]|nr:sensor histidine kinase [Chitinophagaceae bacterium]
MQNRKQFLWTSFGFTCIIFLIAAGALWNPRISIVQQDPAKKVQQKVLSHLKQLKDINRNVVNYLNGKQDDSKIYFYEIEHEVEGEWVCIYKNKELIYWSTYQYVPQWKNIEHVDKAGIISDAKGKYLTYRTHFNKGENHYDVVSVHPLYRNYPIANNYLKSGTDKVIFGSDNGRIVIDPTSGFVNIKDNEGNFLFAYELEQNYVLQTSILVLLLLVSVVAYFLWLFIGLKRWYFKGKYHSEKVFVLLLSFGISVKLLLYMLSKWSLLEGIALFDPSYFAYSVFSPSIGDFFINAVIGCLISAFIYRHYLSFAWTKRMLLIKGRGRLLFANLLLLCSFGMFVEVYHIMDILQRHSQSVMDITSSVDFDWLRVLSVLTLLLVGLSYYYINHTIIRVSVQLASKKSIVLLMIVITCCLSLVLYYTYSSACLLPFIHLLLLTIILYTGYIREVSLMRYQAYLYFFFYAIEIAWVLAFAVQGYYVEKLNRDKEKYYYQLFVDNDIQGEYLLHDALDNIAKDAYIKNVLLSPFGDKEEQVEHKIRKIHLSNYFDKFDINVFLFDANQKNYADTTGKNDLSRFTNSFLNKKFRTQFPNIYLVEEPSNSEAKKYYCFQRITYGKLILGYLVIELKYKKIQPNSVYPELLVDRKYKKNIPEGAYNYAVYEDDKLIYSSGVLNYYSTLNKEDRKALDVNWAGIFKGDFHHWAKKNEAGQLIIISSEASRSYVLITNFSFFFIINVFILLVLVLVNLILFRFSKKSVSYASRIQVYINIAFFLPLSIMSIVSLSVITNNYLDGLNKKITGTAEEISVLVAGILDQKKGKTISWTNTQDKITDLSRYSEVDLNVYTNKGVLYYSNQQDIYKKEIVSRQLNPKAYSAILEQRNQAILLNENIGELDFKMVYTAIRSQESGLIYGVLSVPFFESKNELDEQLIQVLNTIMNLFSFTFIALLILSYFASKYLTYPLHMITQKLSRISLTSENEPLQWTGDDEIGRLITQYNSMLKVLEENKKMLSRTEKESAWREMAKQVAHEIKNPLTPMKLSLQHLIRRIDDEKDLPLSHKEGLMNTIHSLLSQIDNLSDIAGSFSAFAKLPEPIMEAFDLTALIKEISLFYASSSPLKLEMQHTESLFIKGDQGWMHNVLNNLIINAYQSIPANQKAEVTLGYTFQQDSVLIYVKDNGAGIPEEIREKVFQPNFSTKFAGSGIGLALAKRGVEYMGGKIWFETMEHQGTTFYIHLPI